MIVDFKRTEEFIPPAKTVAEACEPYIAYAKELESQGDEVYFALAEGCLLTMVVSSDAGIVFLYPKCVTPWASEERALKIIAAFALDNELTEVITDVGLKKLTKVIKHVRHADVDRVASGIYTVSVKTECMLCKRLPEVMVDDVYLGELSASYAQDYFKIVTDPLINRYTGYDLRREMPELKAEDLIEEARAEFDVGTAMTFAATVLNDSGENKLIGEGVLYRFDGRGEAELSVKLLAEHTGKGYGKKILSALIEIAEGLGLSSLVCRVHKDNSAALALFGRAFKRISEDDGIVLFRKKLD